MKKILVPVDGSAASLKAAEKALEIAKRYNSEITLIYVMYEPDISKYNRFGVVIDPDLKKLKERLKETEKKMMDSIVDSLDTTGIEVKRKIVPGIAAEEIINEAENGHYDMIVMGRLGFSKVKRFFLGSVAHRVLADAPCPVLIVQENHKQQ